MHLRCSKVLRNFPKVDYIANSTGIVFSVYIAFLKMINKDNHGLHR